jgi:hypothetical protein
MPSTYDSMHQILSIPKRFDDDHDDVDEDDLVANSGVSSVERFAAQGLQQASPSL